METNMGAFYEIRAGNALKNAGAGGQLPGHN
jgi:hypothetical protein